MNPSDIITVVRDQKNVLGKQFSSNTDGTINKQVTVHLSVGEAVQHYVPNVDALENLLATVAEDSHAAIINSAFPLVPVGTPFLILSENEFLKHGIKRNDDSVAWPVDISHAGTNLPALGRFKEHTAPSSWVLLDRDVDSHTPEHYAKLSYDDWFSELNKLIPGVLQCARLRAHSSSARVSVNGIPTGGGNGHTWLQIANPEDINRLRSVVKARAIALGMSWAKPRRSSTTGEVVGQDIASIIDWSVFTTGRLVFVGKPEVHDEI
jgi:hypothetical protein